MDSLASIIESSKAAKGELLLDNGQISKYLYYVESGLLRQFYYKNKRDITEHFSCEGNIVICIASTFQREPTRLLIEALEPTVYHRISFSEFSDLLKTSLAIRFFLRLKNLCDRFKQIFSFSKSTKNKTIQDAVYMVLEYETTLAYNKSPNSNSVYKKLKDKLTEEWSSIKEYYDIR